MEKNGGFSMYVVRSPPYSSRNTGSWRLTATLACRLYTSHDPTTPATTASVFPIFAHVETYAGLLMCMDWAKHHREECSQSHPRLQYARWEALNTIDFYARHENPRPPQAWHLVNTAAVGHIVMMPHVTVYDILAQQPLAGLKLTLQGPLPVDLLALALCSPL